MALKCSFCGKDEAEVKKLVAGPRVYICDGCIGMCTEILRADELGIAHEEGRLGTVDDTHQRIHALLDRSRNELGEARVLFDRGRYRLAVVAAREGVRTALAAWQYAERKTGVRFGMTYLVRTVATADSDFRELHEDGRADLITQPSFARDASREEAQVALDTADRMVAFVERTINAA